MEVWWMKGVVGPRGFGADGSEQAVRLDRLGGVVTSQLRGKWAEQGSRGKVFQASVTGVTIPAVANNLASVFGLYNPADSGIDMEIIDTEISQVLAATVVNQFAWYIDTTRAKSLAAGSITLGTVKTRRMTEAASPIGKFYSAVTHSGTPELYAPIGQDGATTNLQANGRRREYDGSLILPPGFLMSVAASTAAGTTNGLAIQASWIEVPNA